MRRYNILPLLAVILCSCGNGGQGGNTGGHGADSLKVMPQGVATADTVRFQVAFQQFFRALQAGDTAALNAFVDDADGFWLIEQPGALPAYAHYTKVQQVKRQYQQLPFISINQQVQACDLQLREQLPSFDCADMDEGASGYAEDGCFYTTHTANFRNTDMWQYANLSEERARQVQELQRQVDVTVLHTASSFRFHFGYRHGRWQLLFADLRVPCSA